MKKAVVLGGGFAGRVVSRMLSRNDYHVQIIESSENPLSVQSGHFHVLLARGLEILSTYYPNLNTELNKVEAPSIDWGLDTQWIYRQQKAPVYQSGVITRSVSRRWIDQFLYDQSISDPNIEIVRGRVCGLKGDSRFIESIILKNNENLKADIYIDCRGRQSPLMREAEALSLKIPREKKFPVNILYQSILKDEGQRSFQRYTQPCPPRENKGVVSAPIENGLTLTTHIEYMGARKKANLPPRDRIQKQREALFEKIYLGSNIAEKIKPYYFKENIWNNYGSSKKWPKNLFVIGDALCRLNPAFGQGMTLSLIGVELLEKHLKNIGQKNFQKDLEAHLRIPWFLACQPATSFKGLLIDYAIHKAFKSSRKHRCFLEIQHIKKLGARQLLKALLPMVGL